MLRDLWGFWRGTEGITTKLGLMLNIRRGFLLKRGEIVLERRNRLELGHKVGVDA